MTLHQRYKKHFWPECTIDDDQYQDIHILYTSVKDSGLPNAIGERIPVDTMLNIPAWEKYLSHPKYKEILDGIKYGWHSGYIGTIDTMDMDIFKDNHLSAREYPEKVDKFIEEELNIGSLKGPFKQPPFEFSHLAPLMSREKSDPSKRRIISDLKFPEELQ